MGLISGTTILTSLCLFHITLGFFFLTNPRSVADQAMVWVLGEAMGLVRLSFLPHSLPPSLLRIRKLTARKMIKQPHARTFETQSPGLAFLGVILALFGITDLVTLSREEFEVNEHWGIQCMFSPFPSLPFTPFIPLTNS